MKIRAIAKAVDSVEGALWLVTQTPSIFAFHLRATVVGFTPENIVIAAGINELKLYFLCYMISLSQ